jgi:hypothetical protein
MCQGLYEDLKQHIQPKKEMRVYIHGASSSEAVGEVGTKKLSLLAIERLYPREVYGLYYGDDIDDSDEIIYETWVVKPVSSRQFSQPGDSGAWVLNDNAELVGMLLGLWTPRNGAPPLSFFTSWSSVADCIEDLPTRSGICTKNYPSCLSYWFTTFANATKLQCPMMRFEMKGRFEAFGQNNGNFSLLYTVMRYHLSSLLRYPQLER